jgi:ribose transport system substrate-binding protein
MKGLLSLTAACGIAVACCATALAEGVDELPPDVAKAYQGLDQQQSQGPSAYRDWKPRKVRPGPLAMRARTPATAGVPRP